METKERDLDVLVIRSAEDVLEINNKLVEIVKAVNAQMWEAEKLINEIGSLYRRLS